MGARQSSEPRVVSMDNPSGVIDVSDDVVQRLKKGITKQARENAVQQPQATPKQEKRAAPVKPAAPALKPPSHVAPPTTVFQNPVPVFIPTGATLSSADVQRQKEIELKQNDELWRQRLVVLEQTLNKTNTVLEKEYETAVNNVRKRFANAAPAHQLPPCQDLKAQLIACYRAHPGETLKCSEEVAFFRNCVSEHRVRKLDAEVAKPAAKAA